MFSHNFPVYVLATEVIKTTNVPKCCTNLENIMSCFTSECSIMLCLYACIGPYAYGTASILIPKYLNCIAGYFFTDMHDYTAL